MIRDTYAFYVVSFPRRDDPLGECLEVRLGDSQKVEEHLTRACFRTD